MNLTEFVKVLPPGLSVYGCTNGSREWLSLRILESSRLLGRTALYCAETSTEQLQEIIKRLQLQLIEVSLDVRFFVPTYDEGLLPWLEDRIQRFKINFIILAKVGFEPPVPDFVERLKELDTVGVNAQVPILLHVGVKQKFDSEEAVANPLLALRFSRHFDAVARSWAALIWKERTGAIVLGTPVVQQFAIYGSWKRNGTFASVPASIEVRRNRLESPRSCTPRFYSEPESKGPNWVIAALILVIGLLMALARAVVGSGHHW